MKAIADNKCLNSEPEASNPTSQSTAALKGNNLGSDIPAGAYVDTLLTVVAVRLQL